MSDRVAEAIAAVREARPDDEEVRLDAIAVLEECVDPRVLPFFLELLADAGELDLARIDVCEALQAREGDAPADRRKISLALCSVLLEDPEDDVRNAAASALSRYLGEAGARLALEKVAADPAEARHVRHNAIFALERAGPSDETRSFLGKLVGDVELARTARRILDEWDPGDEGE